MIERIIKNLGISGRFTTPEEVDEYFEKSLREVAEAAKLEERPIAFAKGYNAGVEKERKRIEEALPKEKKAGDGCYHNEVNGGYCIVCQKMIEYEDHQQYRYAFNDCLSQIKEIINPQ